MLLRLGLETEEMLPGPVRTGVEQLAGVLRRLQFSARQAEDEPVTRVRNQVADSASNRASYRPENAESVADADEP
jgi:hypothetical protein